MKDTKIKFRHGGVEYAKTLSQVLSKQPGFTRTLPAVNKFLAEFSPNLRQKYGDYLYRLDGDCYHGYSVVAVDPASPGNWWNETYAFHRTPASALNEWARAKGLI